MSNVSMFTFMGDFRQLTVWKSAQSLALEVHRCTGSFPYVERYGLAAQMRRAAISVVSNIAEGCGRQNDRELAYFLRIARGSVREIESQLLLSRDLRYITHDQWAFLDAAVQEISKMLNGFSSALRSGQQLGARTGTPARRQKREVL
jgi:four helix bundle protein